MEEIIFKDAKERSGGRFFNFDFVYDYEQDCYISVALEHRTPPKVEYKPKLPPFLDVLKEELRRRQEKENPG